MEVGRHPRQIVKRAGQRASVVARRRADHAASFPKSSRSPTALADGTVLDGEVLAFRDDRPLPFSALQQRIGRERNVSRTARDVPVVFMAYDVLEHHGDDVRARTAASTRRRTLLESIIARRCSRGSALAPAPQTHRPAAAVRR